MKHHVMKHQFIVVVDVLHHKYIYIYIYIYVYIYHVFDSRLYQFIAFTCFLKPLYKIFFTVLKFLQLVGSKRLKSRGNFLIFSVNDNRTI